MSILRRRKPEDHDLISAIGRAVAQVLAGEVPATPDPPPAAPQGRHMRALLRDMQTPSPVARKPPVPVSAPVPAHAQEFITPGEEYLPANTPKPKRPLPPTKIIRDAAGLAYAMQTGEAHYYVQRDANNRIAAVVADNGFIVRNKRDENGRISEIWSEGIPPNPWGE